MEKNGALESEMLPRARRRWCVAALDFLLSFFCATLPVACGWKGLWILLDAAIYPDWSLPSAWTSFVIGVIGVYFQSFFRDHMQVGRFPFVGLGIIPPKEKGFPGFLGKSNNV